MDDVAGLQTRSIRSQAGNHQPGYLGQRCQRHPGGFEGGLACGDRGDVPLDLSAGGADRLVDAVDAQLQFRAACRGRGEDEPKVGKSLLELDDGGADCGAQLVVLGCDPFRELLDVGGLAEPLLGLLVVATSLVRKVCPGGEATGELGESYLVPVKSLGKGRQDLSASSESRERGWQ